MIPTQTDSMAPLIQARRRSHAPKSFRRMGRSTRQRVPLLLITFFVVMIASEYFNRQVFGFNLTGWGWVTILLLSTARVVLHSKAVTFPVWIWAPWVGYVLVRAFGGYEFAWQSTAQIVCPVVAGVAASTYHFASADIASIHTLIRRAFLAYCVGFILFVAPASISNVEFSGFPGGAISALLFQSVFLANYVLNGRRAQDVICYLLAVAVPFVSGNRGPLVASLGLLIFAIMPISMRRRLLFVVLAGLLGVGMFYSPKIQHKMFYSGHGTLSDLRPDSPDLNSNGRGTLWPALLAGMEEKSWLGQGGNADRTWLLDHGLSTYLPHNDWLRVLFNYGWFGVILYALTMGAQIFHLRRLMHIPNAGLRALVGAAASCVVPYMFVMFTDNVLIYCQAFTVPALAIIGVAYGAAYKTRRRCLGQHSRGRLLSLREPFLVGTEPNGT